MLSIQRLWAVPKGLAVVLLWTVASSSLSAESSESLAAIHNRLKNHRRLAQNHAVVFAGKITSLQAIPQPTCKAGIEHRVTYRISEILWVEPDFPEAPGYIVTKGFIDCTEKPLVSPPFVIGARVLVYCEARHAFACLPPVELTKANAMSVRSWLDELQAAEGGPALLQIHERFLQDAALVRRAPPGMSAYAPRPFLFIGKVTRIQKLPKHYICTVCPRLDMDLSLSRVLWGDYKDSVVHTSCNSLQCGGTTIGETVFMLCYATSYSTECSSPALYSEDALKKLESWIA